ncbi:MAG: LysR family transcriptional regulator [Jannaschia sp.]
MRANLHSIREYEALRAVISSGTTSGAARLLGISQPAVSRAVAQLETRLNLILFERRGGRLRPTAEAVQMNRHLDRLFDAISYLERSDPGDPGGLPIRLAAPPSLSGLVCAAMAGFLKLHPGQSLSLETCTSNGMVSRLVDDAVDLGFTHADLTHSAMELLPFHESEAVCVMARGHPLSRHDVITPDLLDGEDFISILRRHIVRSRLDKVFSDAGAEPNRVADVATGLSAVALARAGSGVAVVCPFPILRPDDPTIESRPFQPQFTYRTSFAVSTIRPQSAVLRAFTRHVKMMVRSDPDWSRDPTAKVSGNVSLR